MQRLFPGTQVTIGPTTDDGFYYDFCREQAVHARGPRGDREGRERGGQAATCRSCARRSRKDEALALFGKLGEKFKLEIVEDIFAKGAKTLTLYSHGDWVDFCLGPHGPSTGRVGVIKLLSVAGAYWRGDHRNAQLQRIYGTAFFTQKELDAWMHQQEEAKKRDHRKLGKELDLFAFHPAAPGAVFWTAKGTIDLHDAVRPRCGGCASRTATSRSRRRCSTTRCSGRRAGHWGKYRENMFLILDPEADPTLPRRSAPASRSSR